MVNFLEKLFERIETFDLFEILAGELFGQFVGALVLVTALFTSFCIYAVWGVCARRNARAAIRKYRSKNMSGVVIVIAEPDGFGIRHNKSRAQYRALISDAVRSAASILTPQVNTELFIYPKKVRWDPKKTTEKQTNRINQQASTLLTEVDADVVLVSTFRTASSVASFLAIPRGEHSGSEFRTQLTSSDDTLLASNIMTAIGFNAINLVTASGQSPMAWGAQRRKRFLQQYSSLMIERPEWANHPEIDQLGNCYVQVVDAAQVHDYLENDSTQVVVEFLDKTLAHAESLERTPKKLHYGVWTISKDKAALLLGATLLRLGQLREGAEIIREAIRSSDNDIRASAYFELALGITLNGSTRSMYDSSTQLISELEACDIADTPLILLARATLLDNKVEFLTGEARYDAITEAMNAAWTYVSSTTFDQVSNLRETIHAYRIYSGQIRRLQDHTVNAESTDQPTDLQEVERWMSNLAQNVDPEMSPKLAFRLLSDVFVVSFELGNRARSKDHLENALNGANQMIKISSEYDSEIELSSVANCKRGQALFELAKITGLVFQMRAANASFARAINTQGTGMSFPASMEIIGAKTELARMLLNGLPPVLWTVKG